MTKQQLNDRVRRLVSHRDNPGAPVDAATLLRAEALRVSQIRNRSGYPKLPRTMAWAFELAAARLEAWGDPAMTVRYIKYNEPV